MLTWMSSVDCIKDIGLPNASRSDMFKAKSPGPAMASPTVTSDGTAGTDRAEGSTWYKGHRVKVVRGQ
jgi:hypothetical protein